MSKRRFTKQQREWCKNYQRETDFEPLMHDFLAGNETFVLAARKHCRWFEQWPSDAYLNVSRHIPGAEYE